MLCKPFFYRAAGLMNTLCICSSNLIAIVTLSAVSIMTEQNVMEKTKNFYILFLIKLILAQVLSVQIAYFRNPKYHIFAVSFDKPNICDNNYFEQKKLEETVKKNSNDKNLGSQGQQPAKGSSADFAMKIDSKTKSFNDTSSLHSSRDHI